MFIGREKELMLIEQKVKSSRFEFGILYGRRRIGKTSLLKQIVQKHKAIYYVANTMGLEYNMNQLSQTVAQYFNEPISFDNLEMIFKYLVLRSNEKRITLIIDEFTYLMDGNDRILSLLQNIIDHSLLDSNLCLIISGSHVGMIEDALSYQKPLYGRSTFKLKLEQFNYREASKFYPNISNQDKVRFYSIFGGVPFYLGQIDSNKSVKENIIDLILAPGAIFEEEISFFLSQEVRSQTNYGRVLNAIASGATKLNEIATKSGNIPSGQAISYINVLMNLGILEKEIAFGSTERSRKTIYRIKDGLFRFHFTYIEKHKSQKTMMHPSSFYDRYIAPFLDEFVSLEFENISRTYLILKHQNELESIGRYWANDAKNRIDIEIDIVASIENHRSAYECKWTSAPIDMQVVNQLYEKARYLNIDQLGFFSRNGYTEEVRLKNYLLYSVDDLYVE
jgi:AAA+ ATPase superfamily predicted ATPase